MINPGENIFTALPMVKTARQRKQSKRKGSKVKKKTLKAPTYTKVQTDAAQEKARCFLRSLDLDLLPEVINRTRSTSLSQAKNTTNAYSTHRKGLINL
jgi:hypothetical protein